MYNDNKSNRFFQLEKNDKEKGPTQKYFEYLVSIQLLMHQLTTPISLQVPKIPKQKFILITNKDVQVH